MVSAGRSLISPSQLSASLRHIHNGSLNQGCGRPSAWVLFKKPTLPGPSDYQPVAPTTHVIKVPERLVLAFHGPLESADQPGPGSGWCYHLHAADSSLIFGWNLEHLDLYCRNPILGFLQCNEQNTASLTGHLLHIYTSDHQYSSGSTTYRSFLCSAWVFKWWVRGGVQRTGVFYLPQSMAETDVTGERKRTAIILLDTLGERVGDYTGSSQ